MFAPFAFVDKAAKTVMYKLAEGIVAMASIDATEDAVVDVESSLTEDMDARRLG